MSKLKKHIEDAKDTASPECLEIQSFFGKAHDDSILSVEPSQRNSTVIFAKSEKLVFEDVAHMIVTFGQQEVPCAFLYGEVREVHSNMHVHLLCDAGDIYVCCAQAKLISANHL